MVILFYIAWILYTILVSLIFTLIGFVILQVDVSLVREWVLKHIISFM